MAKQARRSLYVTPLKAIAEEKRMELERLCAAIHAAGGPRIHQVISTGDYVTTGEFIDSPPPERGEIIICTPERLDLILRETEGRDWARTVGSYVFDEFQLLGDRKRGPAMDRLLTHVLVNCPWSRIVALSATIGNPETVRSWLGHLGRNVLIVEDSTRYPCLERLVVSSDDKDAWLAEFAETLRGEPSRSALVFVSTRARTRTVAQRMGEILGASAVAEFHAGLTGAGRMQRITAVVAGSLRAVVATTSLKMGVNLPVTDVVVLDGYLAEEKERRRLSTSDLAQMIGRAGRGNVSGRGWIIGAPADAAALAGLLRAQRPDELRPSSMEDGKSSRRRRTEVTEEGPAPLRQAVLSELAGRTSATCGDLASYLSHAFAAQGTTVPLPEVRRTLWWMAEKKLCFLEEGSADLYQVTKIGRVTATTGVSPETGALFAGFLRAMLQLGEADARPDGRKRDYLSALTDLDLLFLTCSSYELRRHALKLIHKKQLIERTAGYIESMPTHEKPLLNRWRKADDQANPTRRLLATLRIPHDSEKPGDAEQIYWGLMGGAVLLHRHSIGVTVEMLDQEGSVEGGDFESSWKPLAIWLVRCLAALCDPKRAYRMRSIRLKALSLATNLAVGCPLGALLRINGIGLQTILHLIKIGIRDLQSINGCSAEQLRHAGIGTKQAKILERWQGRRRR
jgi:replicative superfamily II helicase